jgi:hypothetical protein
LSVFDDHLIFLEQNVHFTVAPYIDRKNLQKKVVRSGQLLRIEADVKGEPPPTITWALKGVVLKSQDR